MSQKCYSCGRESAYGVPLAHFDGCEVSRGPVAINQGEVAGWCVLPPELAILSDGMYDVRPHWGLARWQDAGTYEIDQCFWPIEPRYTITDAGRALLAGAD